MSEDKKDYSLSTKNVKTIPFNKYEKNFTFIVNGKRYETSRFVADLLSPIISDLHYNDETLDEFTLNITSEVQPQTANDDSFQQFLQIVDFNTIKLDSTQRKKYGEYFLHLGNIEEYLRLIPEYFDDLTPDNIIDRLQFTTQTIKMHRKETEAFNISNNIMKMIEYASEHFNEIPHEKKKTVGIDLLGEIIKNEKLRLEDEDSLLHLILELYEEDHEYSVLFEYVEFKNLKSDSVREFIDHFDIEYLCSGVWRSICARLVEPSEPSSKSERYISKYQVFSHKEGDEFNGILRHLTDETGGNIHDNGTIDITSNSTYSNYYPRNIVDYQNSNYYCTNDQENSEICFDFKDRQIQITNYSLKSYSWSQNSNHLKNWVIQVSNDKKSWEEIDKHDNYLGLNGPNLIATFKTKEMKSFYRFVRLLQTGKCCNDSNYHTSIVSIEFYGLLKQS